MACPKCGCKVCYQYDDGDDVTPSTPDNWPFPVWRETPYHAPQKPLEPAPW